MVVHKAVQQAYVLKCMPFVDFLLRFIVYGDVLHAKIFECALNLSVFLPLFHRFSELCLEPSDRPW